MGRLQRGGIREQVGASDCHREGTLFFTRANHKEEFHPDTDYDTC